MTPPSRDRSLISGGPGLAIGGDILRLRGKASHFVTCVNRLPPGGDGFPARDENPAALRCHKRDAVPQGRLQAADTGLGPHGRGVYL